MTISEPLDDPAGIDALYEALPQAAMSGDARAYAALFTADGVIMRPGAPPAVGREAIEAWAAALLSGWVVDIAGLDLEPVEHGGALAWHRYTGHGHYRAKSDGRAVPFDQKYATS